MSTTLKDPPSLGLASLVGGIVDDAQHLVGQQVTLLRSEIRQELKQAKHAAMSLLAGLAVAVAGGGLLLLTAAHALATFTSIPLWGCYGIVGGTTLLLGAGLIIFGKKEASDVELLPPPQTAGAMKENYQWITGQTKS